MSTVRQYRGQWVADFRDQNGRRRIERAKGNFESKALEKRAAQALLRAREAEVQAGTFVQVSAKLTFATVAERYLGSRTKASAHTVTEYRQLVNDYVVPEFGTRKVEAISVYDVERSRDGLRARPEPVGARTVNKLLTLLYMVLGYAHKHGWVAKNGAADCDKLPQPEGESRVIEQNVLGPDELERLRAHARDPYRLPITFAVYTGARQSEILALRWSDIDWVKGEARIRRRYRKGGFAEPKTKASRRAVELPEAFLHELKVWRLACPKRRPRAAPRPRVPRRRWPAAVAENAA